MVNTVGTLNGLFKKIYSKDGVAWAQPKNLILQKDLDFVPAAQELGEDYNQPVFLTMEQGVTYSQPSNGAFDLDDPVAAVMKNAVVDGYQAVLRSSLSYEAAAKAARNSAPGAFRQAFGVVLENMLLTLQRRKEIDSFYGQTELGLITGSPTTTITIDTAEFAPGIWSAQENAKLEIFDAAGTTQRTGTATVNSMDLTARTITVDALPTGSVATDRIFFKTQRTTSLDATFPGVHKILENSGTLFNIDAGLFDLWKSNSVAVGGVDLSFDAVHEGVSRAMGKGLDEDQCLYVNPRTWKNLLSDIAANRRYDARYMPADAKVGHERIEFHTQVGVIDIKSSIYVKEGFAYLLAPKNWKYVGATDILFRHKDRGDEFFRELTDKAGYEVRSYWNMSPFTHSPGTCTLFTGIVNS